MTDMLQEFCDSRGVKVRVDRQAGVIRGVKVLGLESRNGRSYLPEALAQAAPLYEEAKVNVNHPRGNPGGPRDYQDRIGTVRNVALRAGEGLFADFCFNPKHALAEQLIWDAEHAPENVGFSHNVEARTARRGDRVVVEAITRVQSVDLVADPATTRGLFESQGTSPPPMAEGKCGSRDDRHEPEGAEETETQTVETSVASVPSCSGSELDRLREEVQQLRRRKRPSGKKSRRGGSCGSSVCPRRRRPIPGPRPSAADSSSRRSWPLPTSVPCGPWSKTGHGWCGRWPMAGRGRPAANPAHSPASNTRSTPADH